MRSLVQAEILRLLAMVVATGMIVGCGLVPVSHRHHDAHFCAHHNGPSSGPHSMAVTGQPILSDHPSLTTPTPDSAETMAPVEEPLPPSSPEIGLPSQTPNDLPNNHLRAAIESSAVAQESLPNRSSQPAVELGPNGYQEYPQDDCHAWVGPTDESSPRIATPNMGRIGGRIIPGTRSLLTRMLSGPGVAQVDTQEIPEASEPTPPRPKFHPVPTHPVFSPQPQRPLPRPIKQPFYFSPVSPPNHH